MGTASTKKVLKQVAGALTEEAALTTSAGAGDADRIPALNAAGVLDASILNGKTTSAGVVDAGKTPLLDSSGKLDSTLLPAGMGADSLSMITSEAIASGEFVNIWNSSGAKVRKSDGSVAGKETHGFVLVGAGSGAAVTVYFEGTNTAVTGQTPGRVFMSAATAGLATSVAPSATGNVVQSIGIATSATSINFEPQAPITLA